MEGDLGVVGARLHAEVAAAARRVELVAGQRGQVAQRRRPLAGQAEARVEERRPQAEGDREMRGRQPECLAGVLRGRERLVVGVADRAPGGHALGRLRPLAQQPAQVVGAQALLDVEGGEVQTVLRRRGDAGLVAAVEGDRLGGRGRGRVVGVALATEHEPAPGGGGDAAARGGREQGPARQAGHRYPDSALAGACESGSASASMTSLSRRTWGLASAV